MIDETINPVSITPLPKSFHEVNKVCSDPNGTIGKLR